MGTAKRGHACLILALLLSIPVSCSRERLLADPKEPPGGWSAETRTILAQVPPGGEPEAREVTYYTNELGMEFVLVQPGEFTMGSARGESGREAEEGPQHQVRITRASYIGAHEVTQEQYAKVMGKNPSKFPSPRNPVERVSWLDAVEFCARLSDDDHIYRLPTEAEWEYACRAGSTTAYCYGDDAGQLGECAWYVVNSDETTHEVGLKQPNAWGLYDVHGNVWEWCQDWRGPYERGPAEDPVGPTAGTYRVVRGGSWFDYPLPLRSAARGRNSPSNRPDDHGFRVVCTPRP